MDITETITHPLHTDPALDGPDLHADLPTAEEQKDGSLQAELRARREEIRGERTTIEPIPGYRGKLAMKLGPVEWTYLSAKQTEVARHAKKNKKAELLAQADMLIKALEEIVIIPDPVNAPDVHVSLMEQMDYERAVGFDEQLADYLGIVVDPKIKSKARFVLFETFPDEIAVSNMYNVYTMWMSHADEEADTEFLGE